eukprot:g539.t1
MSVAMELEEAEARFTFYDAIEKERVFPCGSIYVATDVGKRRHQEDRLCVSPGFLNPQSCFLAVFDGTVGDYASENVRSLVLPAIQRSAPWRQLVSQSNESSSSSSSSSSSDGAKDQLVYKAVREGFLEADAQLLEMCRRQGNHYSSTTGVAVLLVNGQLTVGHVGDSRAVVGYHTGGIGGAWIARQMTADHKPDSEEERSRIEAAGGSVVNLVDSNYKPFIRGGDFLQRKASGEKVYQLMYSRAFGGKDLKPFGLVADPTVSQFPAKGAAVVIVASDGLWDNCDAETAVIIAQRARAAGADAALELVRFSQRQQKNDNVTVVVFFPTNPS